VLFEDLHNPFDLSITDPNHPIHHYHMEKALEEAAIAAEEDEVPVGVLIVHPEFGIIAQSHNQREQLQDPTAHAEMIALTQAASALKSWRLEKCWMYVTLEPCPMCAGGIIQARVPMVIYGASDPKGGACQSLYQLLSDPRLNHRSQVVPGVLADRCGAILTDFFASKRAMGKK
jgi:tRNA(adenine34) deaminase